MPYHPSADSVELQTNINYYAASKALNTIGYVWLIHLTWRFFTHRFDWQLATGCIVVSGLWLILTRIKIDHLLQTYFDVLSRIEMHLPVVLGLVLSSVALIAKANWVYHLIAIIEIACWLYLFVPYRHNQLLFEKQGFGPVPKGTWVSPPASELKPGDLLLTSGRIARALHESVGHAETVLQMPNGEWMAFSSYMDKGTKLHPLSDLTGPEYDGYYVALHLKKPWTEEESKRAAHIALGMEEADKQWAVRENEKLDLRLKYLPLPQSTKDKLKKIFHVTGYDWFGTFMGRVAKDHWTCIGACLELYRRMGVETNHYGTGLLGFGTTLFDPIMPVRFFSDPAFELEKHVKTE